MHTQTTPPPPPTHAHTQIQGKMDVLYPFGRFKIRRDNITYRPKIRAKSALLMSTINSNNNNNNTNTNTHTRKHARTQGHFYGHAFVSLLTPLFDIFGCETRTGHILGRANGRTTKTGQHRVHYACFHRAPTCTFCKDGTPFRDVMLPSYHLCIALRAKTDSSWDKSLDTLLRWCIIQ